MCVAGPHVSRIGEEGRHLSSEILIRNGLLAEVGLHGILPHRSRAAPNYLVTDRVCGGLYAGTVLRSLEAVGVKVSMLMVPDSIEDDQVPYTESSRVCDGFRTLTESILKLGVTKHTCIISLGGGVVNTVCGLLAATLYRGIPLVHITTTTMGAFDAAIDFKQAINHPLGKNLLGAYYPASKIVIDPEVFTSLSPRHALNGIAEALKHGLAHSRRLVDAIVQPMLERGRTVLSEAEYLETVCCACIETKVPTLTCHDHSDFNEMAPQYGHAVGHAIEHLSWYPATRTNTSAGLLVGLEGVPRADSATPSLLHGEALAAGMCISAEVARLMGVCDDDCVNEHYKSVKAMGLPAHVPDGMSIDAILCQMGYDKNQVGVPTMGLCSSVGRLAPASDTSFAWSVPLHIMMNALQRNIAHKLRLYDSGAVTLADLPAELLLHIAVMGAPLFAFRTVVRFDVPCAAARRIQLYWRSRYPHKHALFAEQGRVLFMKRARLPAHLHSRRRTTFHVGTLVSYAPPDRWNVRLLDGSMYFAVPQNQLRVLQPWNTLARRPSSVSLANEASRAAALEAAAAAANRLVAHNAEDHAGAVEAGLAVAAASLALTAAASAATSATVLQNENSIAGCVTSAVTSTLESSLPNSLGFAEHMTMALTAASVTGQAAEQLLSTDAISPIGPQSPEFLTLAGYSGGEAQHSAQAGASLPSRMVEAAIMAVAPPLDPSSDTNDQLAELSSSGSVLQPTATESLMTAPVIIPAGGLTLNRGECDTAVVTALDAAHRATIAACHAVRNARVASDSSELVRIEAIVNATQSVVDRLASASRLLPPVSRDAGTVDTNRLHITGQVLGALQASSSARKLLQQTCDPTFPVVNADRTNEMPRGGEGA